MLEPVPARLEPTLEFQFGDPLGVYLSDGRRLPCPEAVIVGAQTRCAVTIQLRGKIQSFGVFFRPSGFFQLFGIPMSDLVDRSYDASTAIGSWLTQLRSRLAERPRFQDRAAIIDKVLAARIYQGSARDPIAAAANYLLAVRGATSISQTAREHGLGIRQFERLFRKAVGISPKRYARIARFQTALDSKVSSPGRSWLEIAHNLYYHDQMHMVHDFAEFAPSCPSRIMSQLGDMRPPAMLSAERPQECRIFTSSEEQP